MSRTFSGKKNNFCFIYIDLTMKKYFATLAIAALSLSAFAQSMYMEPFKHMSASIEAGTTGAGINIAVPVVRDRLVLVAGYNFPTLSYNLDIQASAGSVNTEIGKYNNELNNIKTLANQYLPGSNANELVNLNNIQGTCETKASLNLSNVKLMLEFYPNTTSPFHFTVGAMMGSDKFVSVDAHTTKGDWDIYKQFSKSSATANELINSINQKINESGAPEGNISQISLPDLTFGFEGETYRVDDLDGDGTADVKGSLVINKIKPYIGVGFGRGIPNKRVGMQLEMGVWYHGTPTFQMENPKSSTASQVNIDNSLGSLVDKVKEISVYPQITLRIVGRLF